MRYPNGRGAIVPESGSRHEYGEHFRISHGGKGAEKHAKHRVVATIGEMDLHRFPPLA